MLVVLSWCVSLVQHFHISASSPLSHQPHAQTGTMQKPLSHSLRTTQVKKKKALSCHILTRQILNMKMRSTVFYNNTAKKLSGQWTYSISGGFFKNFFWRLGFHPFSSVFYGTVQFCSFQGCVFCFSFTISVFRRLFPVLAESSVSSNSSQQKTHKNNAPPSPIFSFSPMFQQTPAQTPRLSCDLLPAHCAWEQFQAALLPPYTFSFTLQEQHSTRIILFFKEKGWLQLCSPRQDQFIPSRETHFISKQINNIQ